MVEECLQLDSSGTTCLRTPINIELSSTVIAVVLSIVGLLAIAAVVLWTILRHKDRKPQHPHDAGADREKRQNE